MTPMVCSQGGFRPPQPWDILIIQISGYPYASIPSFSCLSPKYRLSWLSGAFKAVQEPQGLFIGGFRALSHGPLAIGLSHHTIVRVFMCFHTNFQLFISKIEDFMAQGQFLACLGPLGSVHRGRQTSSAMRLSHHTILRVSKCFYTNFQLFISKFKDFMAQGWFLSC